MRRSFFSMLIIACMMAFTVACNQSDADSNSDATAPAKQETKTDAAKPAAEAKPAGTAADAAPADEGPKTKMEFDDMTHDFGTIDEGDKVSHIFKFKNTGEEPLIINSAKGSCGCTVPKWPKDPILPGEIGEIDISFNTKGKPNKQTKTVIINANTDPNPTRLTIKAFVEKKKEETQEPVKKEAASSNVPISIDETVIEEVEEETAKKMEEEIFINVEEMPEFPGGQKAMYKFLAENIKYPAKARDENVEGRVFVGFVITEDGSITDVELKRGLKVKEDMGIHAEAIRVIESMPKWKAGKQRGKAVKVAYTMPMFFKLDKKNEEVKKAKEVEKGESNKKENIKENK